MKRVLIIEDDPELNRNIKEALEAEGIDVETVYNGLIAERILNKESFDCIILDINLPGKTGYELSEEFRKHNSMTPILMLSAFGELDDKIKGYDLGADDYLTKPFYMRELIMRINSLIKRNKNQQLINEEDLILVIDDITLQKNLKKVTRQGKEIVLTPREYQILEKLLEAKGEIVSKRQLVQEIWGRSFDANTNTIEVYINFLRNKIDKPFGKQSIKTKIGYGYYFEDK